MGESDRLNRRSVVEVTVRVYNEPDRKGADLSGVAAGSSRAEPGSSIVDYNHTIAASPAGLRGHRSPPPLRPWRVRSGLYPISNPRKPGERSKLPTELIPVGELALHYFWNCRLKKVRIPLFILLDTLVVIF